MSWLLSLLACAGRTTPPAVTAPDATATPDDAPQESVQVHMAEHLARSVIIRDAVVRGNFELAREGFQWMADHEPVAGLPAVSAGWLEDLRRSAAAGAAAETIQAQGAALGAMANTCGGCHQSLSVGPLLQELPAPAEGEGLQVHMAQHRWASDRMWTALIEPSSAAWERSLRVLSTDALSAEERAEWGLRDGVEVLDQEVHRLAYAALADDNPDTRADLYGQIVARCAACHRSSRGEEPR
jgi:cytochrome c553